MTIDIPDHLVKAFKDFVEVHVEMFDEVDDGSSPELTELMALLEKVIVE
jgi:hypothetical protein